ncbi:hypothetical protein NMY22_g17262 [Coprinellus aureogranulatus]|nr:hypothetical protein NMY22_g17262 [Coprinellus aureogranulatus]
MSAAKFASGSARMNVAGWGIFNNLRGWVSRVTEVKKLKLATDPKTSFEFLDRLTEETLEYELKTVTAERLAWEAKEGINNELQYLEASNSWGAIMDMNDSLVSSPVSPDAPSLARQLHREAMNIEPALQSHHFMLRTTRWRFILLETWAWRWVDVWLVEDICLRWRDPHRRRDDWLDALTRVVSTALVCRHREIIFDPVAVRRLKDISPTSFKVTNTHWNTYMTRKSEEDEEKYQKAVVDVIREALPKWLGFSSEACKDERMRRVRAHAIHVIQSRMGDAILTTNAVWSFFDNFSERKVLKTKHHRGRGLPSMDRMQAFNDAFDDHPVMQKGSTEFNLYCSYMREAPDITSGFFQLNTRDIVPTN